MARASRNPGMPSKAAVKSVAPPHPSRSALVALGKGLRDKVPRESHAEWKPPADRADPLKLLEESNKGRIPALIPVRFGRMVKTPFTFFRGAAFGHVALCGWTLARAHARSGEPAAICGYLGTSDAFDKAIAKFAAAYADQNERGHDVLRKAVQSGRVDVVMEAE